MTTTKSILVGPGRDGVAVYVQLQPDGGGVVYKHGQRPVEGVAVYRYIAGLNCEKHGKQGCAHIGAVRKAHRLTGNLQGIPADGNASSGARGW